MALAFCSEPPPGLIGDHRTYIFFSFSFFSLAPQVFTCSGLFVPGGGQALVVLDLFKLYTGVGGGIHASKSRPK